MTDYTELKRLAEAAPAGPWYQHGGIKQVVDRNCEAVCETFEEDGDCPTARFIAAANPAAVLALLDDLEEARNGMKYACGMRLKKEIDRLQTENEALRKDAERYRWLRDKSESVHQFYLSTPIWFTGVKFSKENVDSTIDGAMIEEPRP